MQDDPFAGMSPVDMAKLRMELAQRQAVTPAQAADNRRKTLTEALSVIPGPGNVMAAQDAYTGAGDAYDQFSQGNYGQSALAAALAGLSGVGAVTGLPVGKFAANAARNAPTTAGAFAGTPTPWVGSRHVDEFADDLHAKTPQGDVSPHWSQMQGAEAVARADLAGIAEETARRRSTQAAMRDYLNLFNPEAVLTSHGRRKPFTSEQ
jgi:hypothetical protein